MYMTRLFLDVERRQTMQALAEPNHLHGAIERAFSETRVRRLWRIDWFRDQCCLLLISEKQPDLQHLADQFGFPHANPGWETRDYSPLLNRLQNGQSWHFRLRANPIHSKIEGETKNTKRGRIYAHVTRAQQKQWLIERAESLGFLLEDNTYDVVNSSWLRFRKSGGSFVSFCAATFEGNLTVVDQDKFRDVLVSGIGREKAYGCGLLTIAQRREPRHD
jgi:CRISPR system Cascade subunit CasE